MASRSGSFFTPWPTALHSLLFTHRFFIHGLFTEGHFSVRPFIDRLFARCLLIGRPFIHRPATGSWSWFRPIRG